ncbi:GNAT family N-acetyltransferase [Oligoflexia bacterium]|nr:GNAT family N-acetyltransferase [Oligoflexia bacterium]
MKTPPSKFNTERLLLRHFRSEDASTIFKRWTSDPEVAKYLTWYPHKSIDESRKYLEHCKRGWESNSAYVWAVELKPKEGLIGAIALHRETFQRMSIGCVFGQAYWGHGYATEALIPVRNWAVSQPETFRLWAVCDIENPASGRVLEKIGMAKEGVLRRWIVHPNLNPIPRNAICYSLVRN